MENKICTKCKILKELSKFGFRKDTNRYRNICKECINKHSKEYRNEIKETLKIRKKNWYINNKEQTLFSQLTYQKQRKLNDPLFKISCNIRTLIGNSFRIKGYSKKTKTQNILGCSFNELKQHLEKQFEPWMNWNNRGLYNGTPNYGWDIDHIVPISDAKDEIDIIKLNHYTNLRPLCSYTNRVIKRHN